MEFAKDKYKLSPEKIKLEILSKTFILDFLDWLEDTKGNAISTRNVRLAALRSFFRFLSYEDIALSQTTRNFSTSFITINIETYDER